MFKGQPVMAYRTVGHRRHGYAAFGNTTVMLNQFISYFSVLAHALEASRTDDPVFEFKPCNFKWGKDFHFWDVDCLNTASVSFSKVDNFCSSRFSIWI
jgi:hypothetical protein